VKLQKHQSVKSLRANAVTAAVYLGLGYDYGKIRAMHNPENVTATKGKVIW
jgi:hypothetical protein